MKRRKVTAVVVVNEGPGHEGTEVERPVRSLEELYAACRDAPTSALVRVGLMGPEGEVRLHFGSLLPPRD
jgi:hypothetical protein